MRFLVPATLFAFAFFNYASAAPLGVPSNKCQSLIMWERFFEIAEMEYIFIKDFDVILARNWQGRIFMYEYRADGGNVYCISEEHLS